MTADQPAPNPEEIEARMAESILGDEGLRDELTDEEAQPLIDFGLRQVHDLARRASAQAAGLTLDDSVDNLRRLMKRINRFVGERAQGDPELTRQSLERVARVSQELYGNAVLPPSLAEIEGFLKVQADLNTAQVVERLTRMFAPPDLPAPGLGAPLTPEQLSGPPKRDQLAGPPRPEQLAPPPQPGLLNRIAGQLRSDEVSAPPDEKPAGSPEPLEPAAPRPGLFGRIAGQFKPDEASAPPDEKPASPPGPEKPATPQPGLFGRIAGQFKPDEASAPPDKPLPSSPPDKDSE
jgi:hypothetical protein